MFNTTDRNNLKIDAVSGTIVKSHRKSFFERINIKSYFADCVLNANPTIPINGHACPVVVLQCMTVGDGELLAEIMWKDDFDELFDRRGGVDEPSR